MVLLVMAKQRAHTAMEKCQMKAAEYFPEGKNASEVARLLGCAVS